MKHKISLLATIMLFCFSYGYGQTTYPVTLKIVDETKSTTVTNDAPGANVIVSIDAALAAQNPRNPSGDWWYPMYADGGVTPNGIYSENANDVTWQITFNATPGEYTWMPYMKSLGWKFLNNAYMYSSDINNPVIRFTVKEDGSVEGMTTITIPAVQPKYSFTIKVIDQTKGALTNDLNDTNNTDKNVFVWISGNVSHSSDWWTGLYYDASFGPTSELIKGTSNWTWQATFEGPAGVYEWNPSMKSLGWQTMNGKVEGVSWNGSNLVFYVAADGSVGGAYKLIVPDNTVSIDNSKVDSKYDLTAVNGVLKIQGTFDNVKVYDLKGFLIGRSEQKDGYIIDLAKGVYIVSVDGVSQKILVK